VRRQSEAATALWLVFCRTRYRMLAFGKSKAVSPDESGLPPHSK
jgi:hypothetical protein